MVNNGFFSSKSLSTSRVFLTLAFLPLLLVALSGAFIFSDLNKQAEQEALAHSRNSAKLLASRTNAFIENRVHYAKLLAGETAVINLLKEDSHHSTATAVLQRYCTTLSASICYILDEKGSALADSFPPESTLVGNNYAFRPYFKNAIAGRSTVHLALGITTKQRGIYFSSPIYVDGKLSGVAIIKFLSDQIEQSFMDLSGKVSLVEDNGIVFASSETDWLYKSLFPLSQEVQEKILQSRQFGEQPPASIFPAPPTGNKLVNNSQQFIYEQATITGLPGWKIVYLLAPEHFSTPHKEQKQQFFLFAFVIFFLVVMLVVYQLFINLQRALNKKDRYRKALEESQRRLQRFEEVTTEAIIIREGLTILDLNKPTENLFGLPREQLLGTDITALCDESATKKVTDLLLSSYEKPFKAEMLTCTGGSLPVVITNRTTLWDNRPVNVTSLRDERRHVAVQKKLMASEGRFRQLSDLVADGILIYEEQVIVDANHALCCLLGERREDLIGTPLSEFFPEEIISRFRYAESSLIEPEVQLPRRDGTYFPAEINCASMQFDDGLYSVLSIRDITRQKEQEEHILYQAQYDLLTHIPNRFLARDRAEHAMTHARHNDSKLILMFIDLDGFKKINDSLGHDVGDRLLQLATRRLKKCINEKHTLARHGGDEFLLIIEDVQGPSDAEPILEEILERFSKPFLIDNKELIATTSIGIALFPDDATDYASLLRAADIGMHKAKKDGRNTFHYYTQEMHEVAIRQLQLDNNLRNAMEREEFYLTYQPVVSGDTNSNRIVGAEALLRWDSKELGHVSPAEFIPLTENTGLIIPIGRWVLEQACQQAAEWVAAGFKHFRIAVNVSPRQFQGNDFLGDLIYVLDKTGLPAKNLVLEVTEGLLIQASTELNETLQIISGMGVKISLDDFGTGYSSLSYLQHFPFNNLKIDRSFIRDLPQKADSKILVSATIAMAQKLGLSVTAEGIETLEQSNYVRSVNCDYQQGFYFGKPVTASEFSRYLNEQGFKLVT